jgi:chemotaxis family two-component system response regulator Rcp1
MPRKPLILHVDDDELVAYLLQREITEFEILFLNNGDQAIEFLTRSGAYYDAPRPALVLLDLHMPKKDGFQILAGIRANPELATVPVAIFTTSQRPADREQALALGADHYIQKPSGIADLTALSAMLARIVRL